MAAAPLVPTPHVDVWIDLLCPWAYLGQDRTDALRELGFEVRSRTYELHPDIPPGGRPVRAGGRLDATLARIAEECAACGLELRAPRRVPNSGPALTWVEAVGLVSPAQREPIVRRLFAAHFVDGSDLEDPDVLAAAATSVGVDPEAVASSLDAAKSELSDSMRAARDAGVAATPAWRFESGFVIPGVQSREATLRWASRVLARSGGVPGGDAATGRLHP